MSERRESEGFLGRWSRLKTEARVGEVEPPAQAEAPVAVVQADDEPPELPPVESLTLDSDFTGFLHPKVDEDLRRSALRKLFSDPHFNVMDGLDVYIDDYSVSEPIPPEMLAGMKQAQRILRWAEGLDDEPERESADAAAEAGEPPPDAAIAAEPEPSAALAAAPHDIPTPPEPATTAEPVEQAVAKPA